MYDTSAPRGDRKKTKILQTFLIIICTHFLCTFQSIIIISCIKYVS